MTASVVIDNTGNSSTLTQYAVKIELTSSNFSFAGVQSDGSDLRVLDSDQVTVIPYYIRSIDTVSQTAEIWARVDSIPGSGTKTIYISKGNSTSPFTIPPTGKFSRPTGSVAAGLAENMAYDSVTNKYYIVTTSSTAAGGNVKLYSSSSPNGAWTDEGVILNVGSAGQWDDYLLYAPHLFKDGSTWYLYYSGAPDGTEDSHSIGYATAPSPTGTFTRYVSNPVVTYSGAGDWKQYRVAEPYVYYSSILGKWVMFYMGDSGSGLTQVEKVGYATSNNPTGPWTDYASNPTMIASATPSWRDGNTVADPFVVEIDGVAYVFLTGGAFPWCIGVYKTTDYITFTEIGQVLGTGPSGRWDGEASFRGAVTRVGDVWYLPFAGNNGSYAWAVGTMSALSTAKGFDPFQVFDYFDEFNGTSIDANIWTSPAGSQAGTQSVAGGVATLSVTGGGGIHRTLSGHREFGVGFMIEAYIRQPTATSGGTNAGEIGLADESDRLPASQLFQYNSTKVIKRNFSNGGGSSSSDMAQDLSTGWQKWSVAFINTSSTGFRVDSNSWETLTAEMPGEVMKPWLFAYSGSADVTFEIDWVIVRKYANPEPTVSVSDTPSIVIPVFYHHLQQQGIA